VVSLTILILHFLRGNMFQRVDAGTGTGFATSAIARRAGPTGHVLGIDTPRGMLEQARIVLDGAHLTNVDLLEADVSGLRDLAPASQASGMYRSYTERVGGSCPRTGAPGTRSLRAGVGIPTRPQRQEHRPRGRRLRASGAPRPRPPARAALHMTDTCH